MFCPHSCVVSTRWLGITRHERADYHRGAPLRERANPLRYEIGLGRNPMGGRRWVINRGGRWHLKLSNLTWRLWRRRI